MARQFTSAESAVPSTRRVDDLVRLLRDAQADARVLTTRIDDAEKHERSSVLRHPERRRRPKLPV